MSPLGCGTGDPRAAEDLVHALLSRRRGAWNVTLARRYAALAVAGDDPEAAYSAANAFLYSDGTTGFEDPRPNGPDPAWAIRTLRRLANAGNVHAMHSLYLAYRRGAGVPRDFDAAERWARRAAKHGDGEPLNNLGVAFREGEGVRRDIRRALRCYRMAAAIGDPMALYNLSKCYRDGEGVRQDHRESVRLIRRAIRLAGRGPYPIQSMRADLGWCLLHGRGLRADRAAGLRRIRRAARAGSARAREMLAELGAEAGARRRTRRGQQALP